MRGRPCFPVFSGGSKSTIRFHSSSVNSYRRNIINTPFSLFYHEKGHKNICFVQFLIFKHALVYLRNNIYSVDGFSHLVWVFRPCLDFLWIAVIFSPISFPLFFYLCVQIMFPFRYDSVCQCFFYLIFSTKSIKQEL